MISYQPFQVRRAPVPLRTKTVRALAVTAHHAPSRSTCPQAIPAETRLEAAAALSVLYASSGALVASSPVCNEDVVLLSHAIDRLLAAAEAWEHSDEAPARKAALLAVQEVVLVRLATACSAFMRRRWRCSDNVVCVTTAVTK